MGNENKTLKVDFLDSAYQFAHGRKPKGRGMWAFEVDEDLIWVQGTMTFAEAKKKFVEILKSKGAFGYVVARVAT